MDTPRPVDKVTFAVLARALQPREEECRGRPPGRLFAGPISGCSVGCSTRQFATIRQGPGKPGAS
jgi:hypothetical protein